MGRRRGKRSRLRRSAADMKTGEFRSTVGEPRSLSWQLEKVAVGQIAAKTATREAAAVVTR